MNTNQDANQANHKTDRAANQVDQEKNQAMDFLKRKNGNWCGQWLGNKNISSTFGHRKIENWCQIGVKPKKNDNFKSGKCLQTIDFTGFAKKYKNYQHSPLGSFGVVLSCGVRARKALFYKAFAGSYFLSGSVKNRHFLRKWCSKWCSKNRRNQIRKSIMHIFLEGKHFVY